MANSLHNFFERIEQMEPAAIENEIMGMSSDDALMLLNETRSRMLENAERTEKELSAGILITQRLRSMRTSKAPRATKTAAAKPEPKVITDLMSLL